jgi:hypothetical protein
MDEDMLKNPVIQRYRYCLLRPKQFWMNQVIYFGIVGLIILINALIFFDSPKNGTKLFKSMYYQILTLEILILWFWASYNAASAIRDEVQRKTYDFFKLMPMSATRKAIGILVGTNLIALLFGAYNLLLLIIFGILGKLNVRLQFYIFFAILSIAILLNTISLLGSVRTEQKHAQTSAAGLILVGLIFGPVAIGAMFSLSESGTLGSSIRFYFLHIPAPLMIAFTSLYFCCWSFAGIVRKFNFERRPLFSYSSALGFMVGYSILVCGFYWAFLDEAGIPVLYSLWLITLIPLLLIPFGAAKTYDMYLEGLRLSKWGGSDGNMAWKLFKNSNLFLWLSLFIIWALFSMGMGFKSGHSPPPFVSSILLLFSFVLFFSLLFEIHVLYQPLYTKIKWFLSFLVLIYLLLPFILQGALGNEGLFLYSPAGYMIFLFDQATGGKSMGFPTGVLVLNFLLCIIAIGLIWRAYIQILGIRRSMSAS